MDTLYWLVQRFRRMAMNIPANTNRLSHETSPYLQQHAHNPVDWYPWSEEALEKARREDKPILLSIGYSACHWCHVMEHESFEDTEVAQVMNEHFVCVKVDREERPDLDKIYQTAHQLLTQRPGGWPLNMFLTPVDHMPFFGGTYFPKTPRYGMPAFTDVLRQIAAVYRDKRAAVDAQNSSLRDLFQRVQPQVGASETDISPRVLEEARAQLGRQFDPRFGGFGDAPKFPHPTSLEFLLHRWDHGSRAGERDEEALQMVRFTLRAMAHGGIYDQLGGGFCRYSVDEQWTIPHFEKMLYDNAQLFPLYADAALATGDELFSRIALETGQWIIREMQASQGGYYSTLDADSEGHEGKFYAWSTDEIKSLVTSHEWDMVNVRYGLQGQPNFEGKWHLNVRADTAAIADKFQCLESEVQTLLASANAKLLLAREQRVHPGRDEKILTSWNGLMIKGMAHAGRLLGRADFIASAARAFDFVRETLWKDGRLLATEKDGKAHLNAYLDDYVFLMAGGLELMQANFRTSDLDFVRALAEVVLTQFEDKANGGFFFTGADHERLLYRPKPTSDDALPSGNGIAAQVLLRLGHVLGETKYLDAATSALQALYRGIADYPSAHGALLLAVEDYLYPPETLVLRGEATALAPWRARTQRDYAPRRTSLVIPNDIGHLPGVLAQRTGGAEVTAYLCTGQACSAPITSLAEMEQALAPGEVAAPARSSK